MITTMPGCMVEKNRRASESRNMETNESNQTRDCVSTGLEQSPRTMPAAGSLVQREAQVFEGSPEVSVSARETGAQTSRAKTAIQAARRGAFSRRSG